MAKNKYYAVRVGVNPGVYNTWSECEKQVKGVSGAEYKSFLSLEEAEQYVSDINNNLESKNNINSLSDELNSKIEKAISNLAENEIIAFVDGSYDKAQNKSSFGVIILSHNNNRDNLYKTFTKELGEEFVSLANVAVELEAVKESINWALKYKKSKITIYYDYEGIEKWAKGEWKANNSVTKKYVSFIQEKEKMLQIEFEKVPSHSGIRFNEEVDSIAKNALLTKGHKTYNDGSVYFYGYKQQDWEKIVQYINKENIGLSDEEEISQLVLSTENIDLNRQRIRIRISQANNTVTINCYKNSKSYVQGKQTALFQKIISTAICLLQNKQVVIKTLNDYHALTLTEKEVEVKFQEMIPNYRHVSQKHYANLLSAVYNTMLTGYMPDYTCLVTPIFRVYEYYLHRILGDKMGLTTETAKGNSYFSFFSRNTNGLYECNNQKKKVLLEQQLIYLNDLYTKYNKIRHPYSHWSVNDNSTAVIGDIDEARDLLNEGIMLVNQYYSLF
ncbi:viroplasmin family protein [Campylobacter lari]|uniref:ribonuclease H1 domain-containing protein n=1 Tax=Campylobacter sp. GB48 TaxID=3400423 RepID=UPI0021E63342|nr:viroplasmin family protein [Campylobacter lari]